MAQYYPESTILNRVHIPYYIHPVQRELSGDQVEIETSTNGLQSVIRLVDTSSKNIYPFIEYSKYDIDTKNWIWTDGDGLPYRVIGGDTLQYAFDPIYPKQGDLRYGISSFDLKDFNTKRKSTFITARGETNDTSTRTFYLFSPILLVINDEPLTDLTDYDNKLVNPFSANTDIDRKFYFDFDNRIYTNQNLTSFDLNNIKVYFYTLPTAISVKARLRSNNGMQSNSTPYVDYYIVKLNGQVR